MIRCVVNTSKVVAEPRVLSQLGSLMNVLRWQAKAPGALALSELDAPTLTFNYRLYNVMIMRLSYYAAIASYMEPDHPVADAEESAQVIDRRRPGRLDDINPELIGLLRGTGGAGFLAPEENDKKGQLSAARGVIVALLLSATFWAFITALVVFIRND